MSPATKKPRYNRSVRVFILFLRLLPFAAVAFLLWNLLAEPFLRGLTLRGEILAMIESGTLVRLAEHSDPSQYTFYSGSWGPEEIYVETELNDAQRQRLQACFSISLDFVTVTKCRFEPHHRLEVVQKDGSVRTMEICFRCGEFIMEGVSKRKIPGGWKEPLREFVGSLGMNPDGPWPARRGVR